MSMYDCSFCGTDCPQQYCERNIKYNKPKERIYSVSYFDKDNPDPSHRDCIHKIQMGVHEMTDKITALKMENNDLKEQLKHYIPRRRVRRVFNLLKDILEIDLTDERMRYVKILQDFAKKIETEGDQVAGQDIKTAIQYLLSIREVD